MKAIGLAIFFLASPWCHAGLVGQLDLAQNGTLWSYTITNNTTDPNLWFTDVTLIITAPVADITSPTNWLVDTDYTTYIEWFNGDADPPYPDDIAPGSSLSGFSFTSVGSPGQHLYGLISWDHNLDEPGPSLAGTVIAPTSVPEPATAAFIITGFLVGLARWVRTTYYR
jgi:hypothetical protein